MRMMVKVRGLVRREFDLNDLYDGHDFLHAEDETLVTS